MKSVQPIKTRHGTHIIWFHHYQILQQARNTQKQLTKLDALLIYIFSLFWNISQIKMLERDQVTSRPFVLVFKTNQNSTPKRSQ